MYFPTGLIRGALAGLNIEANVSAEIAPAGLPGVIFQIRTGPGSSSAGASQGGSGGLALSAGGGLGR